IGVAEAARLHVQLACQRCRGNLDMTWEPPVTPVTPTTIPGCHGRCQGCQREWAVEVVPRLLHEACNTVALLKPHGCFPVDLLPSEFGAGCEACSGAVAFRAVTPARVIRRVCLSCHRHVAFGYQEVELVARSSDLPARGSAGGNGAAQHSESLHPSKRPSGPAPGGRGALVLGHPLPSLGTCKHYERSHRWLRFPCCGRLFPCDVCHEEAAEAGGKCGAGIWAQRMVCGFCSKEQACSSDSGRCSHCSKRLGGGSRRNGQGPTRFWEGGLGCRDKKSLCNKDSHKYKDSKLKTHCKRSERVGLQGKKEREKAKSSDAS
ncbi:hypothetical protein CYMTET_47061, partial [Cymbomonas tetramitiformis]